MPPRERRIVHVDVTAFCVAVERVVEPRLRGRPVLVAPVHSSRAVVCDVSTEAWRAGVWRGMQVARARKLCRDVTVVPPHPDLYRRATDALFRALNRFSPLLEAAGAGHFFVDLSGTQRLFGPAQDAAERIRRELARELRLDPAVGLAPNKLVSKVASRTTKPVGLRAVREGDEGGFLAPLRVSLLPGLGALVLARMDELNLRWIRELAALTREQLALAFGAGGLPLAERARGIDPTPVLPAGRTEPAVRRETTLPEDSNDDEVLIAHVYRLVEEAVCELRRRGRWARELAVTVAYTDGMETTRRAALARPTDVDFDLYPVARELLAKAFARRVRVRRLAVRMDDPAAPDPQLGLFDALAGGGVPAWAEDAEASGEETRQTEGASGERTGNARASNPSEGTGPGPAPLRPESARHALAAAVDLVRARHGWGKIAVARATGIASTQENV